ncbi:MAG TPA: lasso peptide biosynthesis B2 protein [Longimicrobiales bacterium]|nr:lasso peptide biosynthesis B2 protein [Longimicrobiales bacterium]
MNTQRPPGVLSCLATLLCMDVLSRVIGLRRTLAFLRRVTPASAAESRPDELIEATAHRVALAAAFYPRRALCLEQSLTLLVLLRRRGVAAELRLGVQPRPFYAHAWVEAGGRPVSESENLPLTFAAFPGLGV